MDVQCEVCGLVTILPDAGDSPGTPAGFTCRRCGTGHRVTCHVAYCVEPAFATPALCSRQSRRAPPDELVPAEDRGCERAELDALFAPVEQMDSFAPVSTGAALGSPARAVVPLVPIRKARARVPLWVPCLTGAAIFAVAAGVAGPRTRAAAAAAAEAAARTFREAQSIAVRAVERTSAGPRSEEGASPPPAPPIAPPPPASSPASAALTASAPRAATDSTPVCVIAPSQEGARPKAAPTEPGKAGSSVVSAVAAADGGAAESTSASFDRAAASAALRVATAAAARCWPSADVGARTGTVVVTFDPSGIAIHAVVDSIDLIEGPIATCVEERFRQARVPPFAGPAISVRRSFALP